MKRLRRGLVAAAVVMLTLGGRIGRAQDAPPVATPNEAEVKTLAGVLQRVEWDSRRRGGPLLVIDPQKTPRWEPKRDPKLPPLLTPLPLAPLPTPDVAPSGYQAEILAPYFGRKVVRCKTLSVLAPTEMVVLASSLPAHPDPTAGLRRDEKLTLLQASLTRAQWRTLGSENGLGAGDLDREQKSLFLGVLPNPLVVLEQKQPKPGTEYPAPKDAPLPTQTILTESQRQAVRVRINRKAVLRLPILGEKNVSFGPAVGDKPQGTPFYQLSAGSEWELPEAFGVKLRDEIPSRLKPSQLNFDAPTLNALVSLEGIKTISDVIGQIRTATKLEIYVDGRAGSLPVQVLQTNPDEAPQSRAGDVLKALCWGLTGTVRKVGQAYLLTDDIEGIGTRKAKISAWIEEGQIRQGQLMTKIQEAIRKQQPMQYVGFAPNDPQALNAAQAQQAEAGWSDRRGRYLGVFMPVGDLSAAQKKLVDEAFAAHQENMAKKPKDFSPVALDRVQVSIIPHVALLVPGVGEVESDLYSSLSTFLPPPKPANWDGTPLPSTDPLRLPMLTQNAVMQVFPRSVEDITLAADAARSRGLVGLWLAGLEENPDLLTQAVAITKAHGLLVYAVVRLLQTTPNADTLASGAINILGETGSAFAARRNRLDEAYPGANTVKRLYERSGDWLRPDEAQTQSVVTRKLLQIAQTPGLAGIVVEAAAPPGYDTEAGDDYDYSDAGTVFGFHQENRLALLRQAGYDPVDLSDGYVPRSTDLSLPFWGGREQAGEWVNDKYVENKAVTGPREAWAKLRYKQTAALLEKVFADFRAQQPTLPLLLRELNQDDRAPTYIVWESGNKLPKPPKNTEDYEFYSLRTAKSASHTAFLGVGCGYALQPLRPGAFDDGIVPGSVQALARLLRRDLKPLLDAKKPVANAAAPILQWDGLVLHFGTMPVKQAAALLEGSLLAPEKPVTSSP